MALNLSLAAGKDSAESRGFRAWAAGWSLHTVECCLVMEATVRVQIASTLSAVCVHAVSALSDATVCRVSGRVSVCVANRTRAHAQPHVRVRYCVEMMLCPGAWRTLR